MSQAVATVSFLQGQAWAKSPDGSLRPLSVGSPLMADEILVTAEGARVELDTGDGQLLALQGGQEVAMSRDLHAATATTADEAFLSDASIQEALTILEQGGDLTTDLEETVAGNNGVGAGDGHGFVQLARIFTDNLDSPEINYQQATTYQSVFASFDSYSARNNPPQVVDQQLVFDEDTILTGQIIASDSENNTLTYTIATAPVNGVVRLDSSTGNFVFTPNENYFGQDSFVVTVTDSGGNSVNTNINLTINPINDAPVATNQDLSVAEDAQLTGQIGASDIDNDPLTYTLTTAPANGSLMLNPDGSFTYTPNTNYNGNDLFVVSISDGVGGITNSTINIAVTPVNDAPVAVNRQVSVAEDTQGAPLNIAAPRDIDGDTLTVSVSGLPGVGSITLADGTAVTPGQELTIQQLTSLRFNAPANVNAIETGLFQYTLSDGEVSVVASVTINVTPLNDAPVASNQNIVTDEDVAYSGKIMATDIDGDLLAYSIDRLPTHGTLALDSATGQFIYTPDANYNGSDLFSVIVNDGRGGIASSVFTVGVTPVNDAPVANNDLASTAVNTPVTIDVRANDTDIDNARSELIVSNPQVDPAQGSVTVNAQGNLVFTPALNFSGTATITYTISDPTGLSSTATASVNVGANTAPTGADKLININEDDAYTFTANDFGFADADLAQTLSSVRIDSLPTAGSLTLGGVAVTLGQVIPVASLGNLIFSPVANAYGNNYANFTFSVQDSAGAFDNLPNTIQFDVSAVNDTPIISTPIPDQNALEDALFSFQFSANTFTDADLGDTLTYAAQLGGGGALPSWLSFDAATRTFSGTPGNDDVGSISIEVIASDGTTSVSHRFNVIVGGVNDAPVNTVPSAITMDEDTVQAITGLSVNDIDAGSSIINVTLQITNGILNVTGGSANIAGSGSNTVTLTGAQSEINSTLAATVNYIPALNFTGTSTFTITTNDNGNSGIGGALVDADTVLITVNPVNDAPETTTVNLVVNEEEQNVFLGIVAPTDIDSANLTITVTGLPSVGSVTLADGTAITLGQSLSISQLTSLQYDAPMDVLAVTDTQFTYTVSDGIDSTAGIANIKVNPVNDAPIAHDDPDSSLSTTKGLMAEYYGYQEGQHGANLVEIPQVLSFIEGRTPDAFFTATTFRYGLDDLFWDGVGQGNNLQAFLGSDAQSLSRDPGDTSDAIIRMHGYIELNAGTYNFRVRGDDGYQIKIGGVVVAEVNGIQSPTGTWHPPFTITESGYHQIEILYWDQGGQAVFQPEISNNYGASYQYLSDLNTVTSGVFNVQEDDVLSITPALLLANDIDVDGDFLQIIAVNNAQHGSVTLSGNGDVIFTPDANYSGPASFEYTVSDGHGGYDTAKVAIYVSPVNDAPSARTDLFITNEDTALTLTANQLASDIESDVLTITSVQNPVNGTVALISGNVIFTPAANYSGPAAFTFTISDGQGGVTTETVSIVVNPVTATPIINNSIMLGGSGDDMLVGGVDADVLKGGPGNDSLTGGLGADVFVWSLADKGTEGTPALDTITDFNENADDKIDISDLLPPGSSSNLTDYLHFTYDSSTNSTSVHISSGGGYSSGYDNSTTDQVIVLNAYNPGESSDAVIISNLISAGKLITD
jgi:VCBS repeat-containing protein